MTEMNSQAPPETSIWIFILIPVAFLVAFPMIWSFVLWLNSNISGWRRLATYYQTDREPEGKVYSAQPGAIGPVAYRGSLNVVVSDEGVFLRPGAFFQFFHPLLFVPWSEFHDLKPRRIFLQPPMIRASLGSPRRGSIQLPRRVFEESRGKSLLSENPGPPPLPPR